MTVQSHNLSKHFSPVNLNVERKGHGEMAAPPFSARPQMGLQTGVRKDLSISPAFGQFFFILSAGFG